MYRVVILNVEYTVVVRSSSRLVPEARYVCLRYTTVQVAKMSYFNSSNRYSFEASRFCYHRASLSIPQAMSMGCPADQEGRGRASSHVAFVACHVVAVALRRNRFCGSAAFFAIGRWDVSVSFPLGSENTDNPQNPNTPMGHGQIIDRFPLFF